MTSQTVVQVSHEAKESHARDSRGARPKVSFAEAFRYWLKLGFINFGGPAGQIAIMHRELVERRRWLSEDRFLHALNYCMLLPVYVAAWSGSNTTRDLHRLADAPCLGRDRRRRVLRCSVDLRPAYSLVHLRSVGNLAIVVGALAGVKPVVVAIVVEAVLKIGGRALKQRAHFTIAAAAFVAIYFLHVQFPLVVLSAGFIGLGGAWFWPHAFAPAQARSENQPSTSQSLTPTAINDHAPPLAHTLPSRARTLRTLAVGLALWVLPFVTLVAWRGWDSLHAQAYRFFTLAALVTFGGAYAVLAYVTQAAVGAYGWLTHVQAVDGLALAETTPGPLIMVLQFVGFMAGWNHPEGMSQTASAVVGALVTTYATFLPCFFFIFLGAPYIEVLRGNKHLTAALSGITAAVVGVVLNLALVFGAAVIWPQGISGRTHWFAAVVSVLAFAALYRFKLDVLWVVLAGGVIGLGRMLVLNR